MVRVPCVRPRGPPNLLRHGGRAGPVRTGEEGDVGPGTESRRERRRDDPDPADPDGSLDRHPRPRPPARSRGVGHRGAVGRGTPEPDGVPRIFPGVLGRDRRPAVQRLPGVHARPRRRQPREPELRGHAPSREAVRRVARVGRPGAGGGHGRLHARCRARRCGLEDARLAGRVLGPLCAVIRGPPVSRLGRQGRVARCPRRPGRSPRRRESASPDWFLCGLRDGPSSARVGARAGSGLPGGPRWARPRALCGRRPPRIGCPAAGRARLRGRSRRPLHAGHPGSAQAAETRDEDGGDRSGPDAAGQSRSGVGPRPWLNGSSWVLKGPGKTISGRACVGGAGEAERMSVMFDANFFIAVIVATIVSFVIGGIWYGPAFGEAWMGALGKTEAGKETIRKRAPKGFAAGLVGAFIAAFVLGLLIQYARDANVAGLPKGIAGGLIVGLLVWFGFLMTTGVSGAIFEGRPGRLVGINQGFWILSYLLMGRSWATGFGSERACRPR